MPMEVDNSARILVVEDNSAHGQAVVEALQRSGHKCTLVSTASEAVELLKNNHFEVVVTDLKLDGKADGLDVMQAAKQLRPDCEVVLITAYGSVKLCRDALKKGAYDFIEKPIDIDELRTVVGRAARQAITNHTSRTLLMRVDHTKGLNAIVTANPQMLHIIDMVRLIGPSDIPVLITGESGTGKELIAHAIHQSSPRSSKPFVPLNCAGLNESILEDELFGHVKGAFTGAITDRKGRFEYADGGTLFLDEIGDMPPAMQAKLLRVLEDGQVVRVGSNEPIQVNVRMVSATNRDLAEAVEEKKFREDLYYRIKGVAIDIPPLRQRREDIPLLVEHFAKRFAAEMGKRITSISPEAGRLLSSYHWPGNVRQLQMVVKTMVLLCDGEELDVQHIPPDISPSAEDSVIGIPSNLAGRSLEELEKEAIRSTLKMVNGNREQAARILGIGQRTLYRKIKEYNLS